MSDSLPSGPLDPVVKSYLKAKTLQVQAETEATSSEAKHAAAMAKNELARAKEELRQEQLFTENRNLELDLTRIKHKRDTETEEARLASNDFQRVFVFDDPVNDQAVNSAIAKLDIWRRIDPGCDITLRIYSPGGDVIAGMYLYDYLMSLKRDGHKLITEAFGYAASMGGILLQAGDVRRVGRESYILIHQISFGVRGKVGEVEDEMEFVKKISDRVLDIFAAGAKRAGENGTASDPLTRSQFKKRWERKDWWLTSDEALRWGVVDEVV